MSVTSTNYLNVFIEVAEDSTAASGTAPPLPKKEGGTKTIARLEYEMVCNASYKFTSDDVMFAVHATRKAITKTAIAREQFFSKGQPCFRASPLTKKYGWGVHSDDAGCVAIYAVETDEYQQFLKDDGVVKKKAMRSKRD